LGDYYSIAHEFCFGILISSLAVIRFLCLSVDTYRTDISQFLYSFRIFASHLRIAKDVALAEVDKQSILQILRLERITRFKADASAEDRVWPRPHLDKNYGN
jgi:hypothetical protein